MLPANGPSANLCKVVASAVALGYPSPVIVNWRQGDVEAHDQVRSHLSKITGVRDLLSWATSKNVTDSDILADDDLVLMLDAYDVWLQLPPSVLIERYLATNERANERIAWGHGHYNSRLAPLQTILASSQKRCYAPRNKLSDLHCDAMPDGELPKDTFGFFTDSMFSTYQNRRPRYLNSGSFMGPARDMLRYFQRVEDRMEQHLAKSPSPDELSGDQGIFAEILGEQEVWRRKAATQDLSLASPEQQSVAHEFEYHVGLDYTQELFYPTCYSEHIGSFVRLHDSESVLKESTRAGVATSRVKGLPSDISKARPPLHRISNSTNDKHQTKGTVTLGELNSLAGVGGLASDYTKPVAVVDGINDLPFCGGNCTVPSDQAKAVQPKYYPNVAEGDFGSYLAPLTGHGLNFHYSAAGAFEYI